MQKPKTIISDIDGTLLKHKGNISTQHLGPGELLPGVLEKFKFWDQHGYRIILVTGRRESTRQDTERQLTECGIFYDHLIMGIGNGVRVLLNDTKPNNDEETAIGITIKRNEGIGDIDV
jgi:hydroxymethylpyrimidine pyrophosphatase-like HAD family hydrolase